MHKTNLDFKEEIFTSTLCLTGEQVDEHHHIMFCPHNKSTEKILNTKNIKEVKSLTKFAKEAIVYFARVFAYLLIYLFTYVSLLSYFISVVLLHVQESP